MDNVVSPTIELVGSEILLRIGVPYFENFSGFTEIESTVHSNFRRINKHITQRSANHSVPVDRH